MNFRKLNVTENERYKQILVRTYKSRLRLEHKFIVEHVTSSTYGLIQLLIEKDFVWLTRQNIWLLKQEKGRVFDQNRVVQILFVDKELYNI